MSIVESREVWNQFDSMVGAPEEEIDLARAALLLAATEYPELSIERELFRVDELAEGVAPRMDDDSPLYQLNTLSEYLFDELKFAGNHTNYYDPRNSFLNDVIERRLGIPITLSLLYIEVGKRLGGAAAGNRHAGAFCREAQGRPRYFRGSLSRRDIAFGGGVRGAFETVNAGGAGLG